jgi:hypothetical protein
MPASVTVAGDVQMVGTGVIEAVPLPEGVATDRSSARVP